MLSKIQRLTKSLFPTGRVWRIVPGGIFDKILSSFSSIESTALDGAMNVLDVILPDNDNFTAQDATDWEVRLGLITNLSLSLEDRKQAIIRKMNHPGTIKARQNYRFLERELRNANFDVYVYENIFSDGSGGLETRTPEAVIGSNTGSTEAQLGMNQLGEAQLGTAYLNKAVWSLDRKDQYFDAGTLLRRTFFIGGNPLGTFANVDATREIEFRELIMKVKPAQTVGWLLVNYI